MKRSTKILLVIAAAVAFLAAFGAQSIKGVMYSFWAFVVPAILLELENRNKNFSRCTASYSLGALITLWLGLGIVVMMVSANTGDQSFVASTSVIFFSPFMALAGLLQFLKTRKLTAALPANEKPPFMVSLVVLRWLGGWVCAMLLSTLTTFDGSVIRDNASEIVVFGILTVLALFWYYKSPKTQDELKIREEQKTLAFERKMAECAARELQLQKKREAETACKEQKLALKKRQQLYKKFIDVPMTHEQIDKIMDGICVPVVNAPIFLKRDEVAVFTTPASLQVVKTRVVGRQGGYGGGSIRIAKGLSIHTGRTSSTPIYGDVATHYPGTLTLTTKRLIFTGTDKSFDSSLSSITSLNVFSDGFVVQIRNKTHTVICKGIDLFSAVWNGMANGLPLEGGSNVTPSPSPMSNPRPSADMDLMQEVRQMEADVFTYFCRRIVEKKGFSDLSLADTSNPNHCIIIASRDGIRQVFYCVRSSAALIEAEVQHCLLAKTSAQAHVAVLLTNAQLTPVASEIAQAKGVVVWDHQEIQRTCSNGSSNP